MGREIWKALKAQCGNDEKVIVNFIYCDFNVKYINCLHLYTLELFHVIC